MEEQMYNAILQDKKLLEVRGRMTDRVSLGMQE